MIEDAYEAALTFYGCHVAEEKAFYSLTYNGIILDTIETTSKIQAVQYFHRRLNHGQYNSVFNPTVR